ncbi:hypothetical protein GDO78_007635 [Eleutherodactylus coqui]|uniref:Uncharacterized protein n=1 Tax=Eleutherodactylus coqui TaxID=57060 RepID=A0A8J6FII9_ELECQ|nr:hypothetical protein GDO78_007635 [Eleutherodactylus coqui]
MCMPHNIFTIHNKNTYEFTYSNNLFRNVQLDYSETSGLIVKEQPSHLKYQTYTIQHSSEKNLPNLG